MKAKFMRIILLAVAIVGFCACEVDFDPNSQWKETTIVYCLLDQDSDTTFVRVQKAFLGDGNYLDFAKVKDSIYYKDGEIAVRLLSFNLWDANLTAPIDTIQFIYSKDFSKPSGDFFNDTAPIYYAQTLNKIKINRFYKLEVLNLRTGNLVHSKVQPLGDYNIIKPDPNFLFTFEKNKWKMDIQWENRNALSNGAMPKMFQAIFRFYYQENNLETFVDLPLGNVTNTYSSTHNLTYSADLDGLVNAIKVLLKNDQPKKWSERLNWMELYLISCDVNMYDYININKPANNLLIDKPLYTNIENGIGLFAARRMYIKHVFTQYNSSGGLKFINDVGALDIGWIR